LFYVSHYASDCIIKPEILANLSSPTGQASGFYKSNVTSIGYFPGIGTGHTYVSNITDWSLGYYTTSHASTTPGFTKFMIFLAITGLYKARKNKTI
ncbi:MAG: hypothetical protein ACXAD7_24435, partial [Candidatus Kariarchaeaceae archaeon]